MNQVEMINALNALSNHSSINLGLVFDCARDNAGFDGAHPDQLTEEDLAEILYHARSIVDSGSLPMSVSERDEARVILGM